MKANKGVRWYDRFSHVFDWFNDYPYQRVREVTIQQLGIVPGDTVIDLFCGTGVNFGPLLTRLENRGTIIAIDGSAGMLKQAHRRIERQKWDESRFQLHQKDLKGVGLGYFSELLPSRIVPKVLLTLGPAGLPGWASFWEALFAGVPNGARFATMDVFCARGTLSAAVINLLGAGDPRSDVSSHKPWRQLRRLCVAYRRIEFIHSGCCDVLWSWLPVQKITLDRLTDVRRDPKSLTGTVPEAGLQQKVRIVKQIEHTLGFDLDQPVEKVFPLFSPEGERAWVPGWEYENIMGTTGLFEDYVFVTRSHDHAAAQAIWIVKRYTPDDGFVQFYRVEPEEKVGVITVQCSRAGDSVTHVQVTYKYIALSAMGVRFVDSFTKEVYEQYITEWRNLIVQYFETGGLTST